MILSYEKDYLSNASTVDLENQLKVLKKANNDTTSFWNTFFLYENINAIEKELQKRMEN